MIDAVREWLRANPVRVRSAIVAVVGWLTIQFPQITDFIGSDALVGVLMGLVTLALGESAHRKVTTSNAASKTYDGSNLPD